MAKALRVYLPDLQRGRFTLPNEQAHYVTRVHRLRDGADLLVFDPVAGVEAAATLRVAGREVSCEVPEVRPATRRGLCGFRLYVAQPKGPALEAVLREAVVLGVETLTFLRTERSAPWSRGSDGGEARLRAIALDAARQCLRGDLPALRLDTPLSEALDDVDVTEREAVHCVLQPDDECAGILSFLTKNVRCEPGALPLGLWFGPEGGFSEEEGRAFVSRGVPSASLGQWVLRVPAAVSVALGTAVSFHAWACEERPRRPSDVDC